VHCVLLAREAVGHFLSEISRHSAVSTSHKKIRPPRPSRAFHEEADICDRDTLD
jgi:hypothetical protein